MEFNFPFNAGSGIAPLLRHGSTGCVDLIAQLCTYDPEERLNAKEALKHPYFKELRHASMMFALQKILPYMCIVAYVCRKCRLAIIRYVLVQ